MPTTYAHYSFGQEVYEQLPADLKRIIDEHRDLYDFGVHGPDILFYHHPFPKDDVYRYSNAIHDHSGRDFFTHRKEAFLHTDRKEAYLSYMMGFACHYLLDRACHSYIEAKDKATGVSHSRIEAEFDRYLLEKAGRTPAYKQDLTRHLHPTKENAEIISLCFPYDSTLILKTLRRMVFWLKLLQAPSAPQRLLYGQVARIPKVSGLYDMVMAREADPRCEDSNLRLDKLYRRALKDAPEAIDNLVAYFCGGEELNGIYDDLFAYNPGWEEIPVLSVEEELKYEVE